jgi:hypothetical protein
MDQNDISVKLNTYLERIRNYIDRKDLIVGYQSILRFGLDPTNLNPRILDRGLDCE